MIVKDVDMDDVGNKTYVFGVDERYEFLKDSYRTIAEAIDNEMPDLALRKIRQVVQIIEEWDGREVQDR